MKSKIALIMVLLMTVLAVTGCGNNSLIDYKKAAEKTDQIVKGQNSTEFSVTLDFNTEGMTPEAVNKLNYYKNMSEASGLSMTTAATKVSTEIT